MARVLASGFVLSASIAAACLGYEATTGTARQSATVVSPAFVEFGAREIGEPFELEFTISPAAGSDSEVSTIETITGCPGFEVAADLPTEIRAGTTFDFRVTFRPTLRGVTTCPLAIQSSDGTQRVVMRGTGVVPDSDAVVALQEVDFGQARVNASATAIVTVENRGSMPLAIMKVSTTTAVFTVATAPTEIPPDGELNIPITCRPNAPKVNNDTLTIETSDPAHPRFDLQMRCEGVTSDLDIQPSILRVHATVGNSVVASANLVNVTGGSAARVINIRSVALSPDTDDLQITRQASGSVTPGSNTSFEITYQPTLETTRKNISSVVIDIGSGVIRSAVIEAEAKLAQVGTEPRSPIDLGPICVGQTGTKPLELFAESDASVQIDTVTTTPPFSISLFTPFVAEPRRRNPSTIDVSVSPVMMVDEPTSISRSIMIGTSQPAQTFTIEAIALTLPDGVRAASDRLDFGTIPVRKVGALTATLVNCTPNSLAIMAAEIEGPGKDAFSSGGSPLGDEFVAFNIAPFQAQDFELLMVPQTAGKQEATLVITHGNGTTTVSLVGDAILERNRQTYYACNAAGGSSVIVIGLAMLFGLRRRRSGH